MGCVGCYLIRFCTLADAARNYHTDPKYLLEELEKAGNGASKDV